MVTLQLKILVLRYVEMVEILELIHAMMVIILMVMDVQQIAQLKVVTLAQQEIIIRRVSVLNIAMVKGILQTCVMMET